jgi:hypothetical protein
VAADETPIAWTALDRGHPVRASDGEQVGKISHVVADEQRDIFSGVAFRSGLLDSERFAPADLIGKITSKAVELSIPSVEADALAPWQG